VLTLSTPAIDLNCLLIALEHIEQVKPIAMISAFVICE
jgi:hypothetical protein